MNEIYIGNDPGSPPETICDRCEKCLAGECDGKPCAPHPDWCEEFTDAVNERAKFEEARMKFPDFRPVIIAAGQRDAAIAERDRLRDIVRRFADYAETYHALGVQGKQLVAEARAALGEGETPTGKGER